MNDRKTPGLTALALVFATTVAGWSASATAAPPSPATASRSDSAMRIAAAFEPIDPQANSSGRGLSIEAALVKALGVPVRVETAVSLRTVSIGIRSGEYDALWVPANIAVSAAKNDAYEIVGFDGRLQKMALLVVPTISKFEELKGKSIYLPQEDSAATIAGVALLSDNYMPLTEFREVFSSSVASYQVASFAIEKQFSSVTVLPERAAAAWVAANPKGGRILAVSGEIPGQTLVLRKSLPAGAKRELSGYFASLAGVSSLSPATPASFKYITGLTHYTPDAVSGVQKVTAAQVAELGRAGAQIVDVRTTAEYGAKHIPNAKLVSYDEISPRFVGADLSRDGFDMTKLDGVKQVVLYCNGPECWKSFKAAQKAIASKKFENVYWFRGGMPEWERNNLATARLN